MHTLVYFAQTATKSAYCWRQCKKIAEKYFQKLGKGMHNVKLTEKKHLKDSKGIYFRNQISCLLIIISRRCAKLKLLLPTHFLSFCFKILHGLFFSSSEHKSFTYPRPPMEGKKVRKNTISKIFFLDLMKKIKYK